MWTCRRGAGGERRDSAARPVDKTFFMSSVWCLLEAKREGDGFDPPVPPPPSSFAAAIPSSKLKTVPTVRVGKKDEGGEKRKWPRVVDSRCILLVFFFLLHVSSSSSLRAPRHNHTNKTSKMDGELKYAAGNYSDCSGMAGEKNTPPHTPTPLPKVSDWMRSKRRDTVRHARREDDASASSALLSRF